MKIAFFDSGMGGLSVLHHAMKVLPHEQFVFYADEDHVPYGTKSTAEVQKFVGEAFDFLLKQDVKAIVVACNTATSVAVAEMRRRYDLPIIGMEPAAKKALDLDGTRRVLVTATPITVKGRKMELLIEKVDKDHLVDRLALPELVTFAERQEFNSPAVTDYLREQLAPFDLSKYSALVLGCTHFNYFKDTLRTLLPDNVAFVDGNEGTTNELIRRLKERNLLEHLPQQVEYFYSGRKVTDMVELERLQKCLGRLEKMYRF
ncbi:putative glutamate racemase [Selenomonas ruminantium subsp. lactilytica TAM6421]|uniref:Glutamate racemase n=1 Tax=Selenomonas ruminantium subsp. lactilytica (strain NBRC 103574 / TAM6421) TaxID=927704 RepID=I0GN75_SELRL|nr:glutamate racemase [Selenomonas ruminantium]BAL82212.1 putative glutamate racemase [Selenomonas ruminantium subsp. lactilytica TAM6421]